MRKLGKDDTCKYGRENRGDGGALWGAEVGFGGAREGDSVKGDGDLTTTHEGETPTRQVGGASKFKEVVVEASRVHGVKEPLDVHR